MTWSAHSLPARDPQNSIWSTVPYKLSLALSLSLSLSMSLSLDPHPFPLLSPSLIHSPFVTETEVSQGKGTGDENLSGGNELESFQLARTCFLILGGLRPKRHSTAVYGSE